MRLSILVVSRTAFLVSSMLRSLKRALHLPADQVEVLCSWNGDLAEEKKIENDSGFKFLIANRAPYHFASNMNALADKAMGEVLLLINDDVILDTDSVDAALWCLSDHPDTGLVGARLRDSKGRLTHAGILFDGRHSPYHQLNRLIGSEDDAVLGDAKPVPAVTGAAMVIRRDNFQVLRLNSEYRVCGEDVELCLALRSQLKLNVMYCPQFSGEHIGEATRSKEPGQGSNSEDLAKMRGIHKRFLDGADNNQLRIELAASTAEADALRSKILAQLKPDADNSKHWEDQTHALQLARLKLSQKLKRAERRI